MPIEPLLLDAGPLVSFLDRTQQHHHWARNEMRRARYRPRCCEAVLTEAFFLVRNDPPAREALTEMMAAGKFDLTFHAGEHGPRIGELLHQYRDLPISFADACLVVMSEASPGARVFTLDSHFLTYRRHGKEPIPLLAPFAS